MKFLLRTFVPSSIAAGLLLLAPTAQAVLPNAWHVPDITIKSGNGGTTPSMRAPKFEFGNTGTVRCFTGIQKFNNPGYGTANQTGGTLFYKGVSSGTWLTESLTFHANGAPGDAGDPAGNNQYWYADLDLTSVATDEVIQYYLFLTFDAGAESSYLYPGATGGDGGSAVTNVQATAAANPFTVRNRAAYIFHAGNRVVNGQNVQFFSKIGYLPKNNDVNKKWVTNGALYYTTDGSTPAGALGVGTGTTQVAPMVLDHLENDSSPAGNAMWWRADTTNLPLFTNIRYKVGFWHTANNEEKFGDYNAPSDARSGQIFSFMLGTAGEPTLTVNGTSANYTTSHVYINEATGTSANFIIVFLPNDPQVDTTTVQTFTNLNRREFATLPYVDINGIWTEEGINPPSGDLIGDNDLHYYRAYPMNGDVTNGFVRTFTATKTGAYRITARYRRIGESTWRYYSSNGRRDHAVVVSPDTARDMRMYEINAMTVEAQGTLPGQRSTFVDLHDGPSARTFDPITTRWNLDYVTNLGMNWLWFQPIHPNGIEGRQIDPVTGQIFETGSPYAVKNFFEVHPLLAKSYTPAAIYDPNGPDENSGRAAAMVEFQNFVAAADARGVNVMLDSPYNHTSYDSELGATGAAYFSPGTNPRELIRNVETRFYSRNNDYCQRATLSGGQGPAVAPDRGDFGKFGDTYDVFFGRYSALVCQNPTDNGNYLNESDNFFYIDSNWATVDKTIFIDGQNRDINVTQNVWKHFSDYILFWLDRTGCPAGTSTADQAFKGFDGLRADFGQGLPPQAWEYIINKARTRKWAFVFMAESLDGGAVTYRSGRHFDVLNENIVFPLQQAGSANAYRDIFENRRSAYGQAMVLLNNTSHDEENYVDPYHALIRYLTCSSVDGVPLVFMGQEMGISRTFGFDRYETNFGKQITHFKKYNSMQPILAPVNRTFALDQLYPVYAAAGQARAFSPALRSSNRYFLDQTGGSGSQPQIFSVAKYQAANGAPNFSDVVFAFVNLDRDNDQQGNFNLNIDQNGSNLFGIKPGRRYNVKNIAAYTALDGTRRDQFLFPPQGGENGRLGSDLLTNGLFVLTRRVPAANGGWVSAPFEAQFLKLYDVTPPPQANTATAPAAYVVGHTVVFNWAAVNDPEGGISGYYLRLGTMPGGSDLFEGNVGNVLTYALNNVPYGTTVYATVSAVNNAGIQGIAANASIGVQVLDPATDADGDGVNNANEVAAGTDPLNANSVLKVTTTTKAGGTISVTWQSVAGRSYAVQRSPDLSTAFTDLSGTINATGASTSYDDTTANGAKFFYRIRLLP